MIFHDFPLRKWVSFKFSMYCNWLINYFIAVIEKMPSYCTHLHPLVNPIEFEDVPTQHGDFQVLFIQMGP